MTLLGTAMAGLTGLAAVRKKRRTTGRPSTNI
jgi:LPXTG-motif cell wall-anchored protein